MDTGGIRWISVSDKGDFLLRIGGSDSLIHGDDGWQSFTGVREVICGENKIL